MADLNLRLGRDVLTIANGARERLIKGGGGVSGLDLDKFGAATLAVEPEVIESEIVCDFNTGAQCVVLNVFDFAPASFRKMDALVKAQEFAKLTVNMAKGLKIQHPLIQIFESDLPFDESSKSSLNEHCEQYKFVAKLFEEEPIDGFLCVGFSDAARLKCALTGIRKVSDKTIIFDQSSFDGEIMEADFAPASSKFCSFDYAQAKNIDWLLDEAIKKAEEGVQFLNVVNASPSKTAAVFAVTNGIYCSESD